MIFNEKDIINIYKMRDIFLIVKQKFYLLKYINQPDKTHYLRNLLSEALFRNIVLEIYSILFDTTKGSIAKIIIDKLINQLETNQGTFKFNHEIPFHSIDDGTINIEIAHEELHVSINNDSFDGTNLDIQGVRSKFKKYRNKVLAHRDYGKFDYHISQEDIEIMIDESEKIITTLLKIIEPTTAYCFDVSIIISDNDIKCLFKTLT